MAEKFGFGGTSTKSRTMLLFGGAVVAVVIGLIVSKYTNKNASAVAKQSTAVNVPHNIDTTPGKEVTERYHNLQVQENEKRAADAQTTGQSAIPTVVGEVKKYDFDLPNFQLEGPGDTLKKLTQPKQAADAAKTAPTNPASPLVNNAPQAPAQMTPAQQGMLAQTQAMQEKQSLQQAAAQQTAVQQKNADSTTQKMAAFAKTLFDTWNTFPKQSSVHGNYDDSTPITGLVKDEKTGTSSRDPSAAADKAKTPHDTVQAGSIIFAVLDTSVNTDEPGPILGTVVEGPYKGARLLGTVEKMGAESDGVQLKFNRMSIPGQDTSVTLDGVAVDPDTARTALASDVDHHYLLRYGALFASSFMQGFGQAISNQGSTTVTSNGTTTTQNPQLSASQQVYSALGTVGQQWGNAVQDYVKRPTTVTVDAGTGFGLLILTDLEVPKTKVNQ